MTLHYAKIATRTAVWLAVVAADPLLRVRLLLLGVRSLTLTWRQAA